MAANALRVEPKVACMKNISLFEGHLTLKRIVISLINSLWQIIIGHGEIY